MSSEWDNNTGGGWEATADKNWGTNSTAKVNSAPEQSAVDAANHSNDAKSDARGNAGTDLPAERGANEEWTGHGQAKYNYDEFAERGGLGDFDGNARVYHWDGEEGDVGPEFPELELELFGPPDQRITVTPADFAK